jgi:hypothetical protein
MAAQNNKTEFKLIKVTRFVEEDLERLDDLVLQTLDNAHLRLLLVLKHPQVEGHILESPVDLGEESSRRLHLQVVGLLRLFVHARSGVNLASLKNRMMNVSQSNNAL